MLGDPLSSRSGSYNLSQSFARNDVDSGTWHSGLDAVAALHRNNLVLATVEDGDVTVHVVTDIVQIRIELAS
ncbi:hypothetical protein F2Q69_00048788 [Brassica cretica]|uniref:Uncharacterized protein n=1 Tax=Brassica cretica TaxID=69181 RepID=A0A8S9Q256_BRACR|nr:hypothetical protein F2Q69_00048788 [Brassica cretica]